jgi:sigma-B regulation protein RsbU (phosphoserine phosphatase)
MAELNEIKRNLSRIEKLEMELHLKQLQINSLLAITQAINENVSAEGLFNMYNSFLRWEMGIRRMALFFKEDNKWEIKTHLSVADELLQLDVQDALSNIRTKQSLEKADHPLLRQFDLALPVVHKNQPIAYACIGGFLDDDEHVFNKIQFITTITNVIAVAIENKRLFKKQMRQEVLNREVELAAEIQSTLIPKQLPDKAEYTFSSIYKPHFAVGGDYFDIVEFPNNRIAFCIADITGKGVPAALLMANFQANLRALVTRSQSLEEVVREVNQAMFKVTDGERYITFFLGYYDANERTLHYINAGHTPPLLFMGDEFAPLKMGCTVLGWLPELPSIQVGGMCLTSDALLFMYTDGLTDVRNNEGDPFGDDRLCAFLQNQSHLSARDLNQALLSHVEQYRQQQPYPDDITVLTCKIRPKPSKI